MGRDPLLAALLAFLVFAVFRGALFGEFLTYDDDLYFTANPHVQAGLSPGGLAWAFRTFATGNWHPLTWMSLMLDTTLFGGGPQVAHATSLALHAASAAILFLLLAALTGERSRAWLAAALFAVHPLRVESVAWASERKDVLSVLLGLGAIAVWVAWTRWPSPGRRALAVGLYAASLLAKPTLVTLPGLLLLLDVWPLGRSGSVPLRRRFLEKWPFAGLAAASAVVTVVAQTAGGTVESLRMLSAAARLGNVPVALARYLLRLVWFERLSFFYPPVAWSAVAVGGCLVFLAGLTLLLARASRERPWLIGGWLWFLLAMIPVIGIVQVGMQSMADRYTYVPGIGLAVAVAWSVPAAAWKGRGRLAFFPAAGLVFLVLAFFTNRQVGVWRTSEGLYLHALEVTRDNALAHNNLGVLMHKRGDLEGAMREYDASLAVLPDFALAQWNLARALQSSGRTDEALGRYREALRLAPEARMMLDFGLCLQAAGRPDEAFEQFQRAVRNEPDNAQARAMLGTELVRRGLPDDGIAQLFEAVRLDPGQRESRALLNRLQPQAGWLDTSKTP